MNDIEVKLSSIDFNKIESDMMERIYEIPLGNSIYQNTTLVPNAQLTPARAYRTLLLNLKSKIQALSAARLSHKQAELQIELLSLDISDILAKIEDNTPRNQRKRYEIEIELKQLEIEKIHENKTMSEKLILDAIVEVSSIYALISSYPKYTRDEFEDEEKRHWKLELEKQSLGIEGCKSSLLSMGELPSKLTQAQVMETYQRLIESVEELEEIKEEGDDVYGIGY